MQHAKYLFHLSDRLLMKAGSRVYGHLCIKAYVQVATEGCMHVCMQACRGACISHLFAYTYRQFYACRRTRHVRSTITPAYIYKHPHIYTLHQTMRVTKASVVSCCTSCVHMCMHIHIMCAVRNAMQHNVT